MPGLDEGVLALDLHGQGTKALFTVDGTTKLGAVSYRASAVDIRGLNAETKVHITQDEIALNDLRAHLGTGGSIDGEIHLVNWLSQTAPSAGEVASANRAAGRTAGSREAQINPTPGDKLAATARAANEVNRGLAQATSNPNAKNKVSTGEVRARLSGFTLNLRPRHRRAGEVPESRLRHHRLGHG